MFINNELFFPFGLYVAGSEFELRPIRRTHINFIFPCYLNDRDSIWESLNKINITENGEIKALFQIKGIFYIDTKIMTSIEWGRRL